MNVLSIFIISYIIGFIIVLKKFPEHDDKSSEVIDFIFGPIIFVVLIGVPLIIIFNFMGLIK